MSETGNSTSSFFLSTKCKVSRPLEVSTFLSLNSFSYLLSFFLFLFRFVFFLFPENRICVCSRQRKYRSQTNYQKSSHIVFSYYFTNYVYLLSSQATAHSASLFHKNRNSNAIPLTSEHGSTAHDTNAADYH